MGDGAKGESAGGVGPLLREARERAGWSQRELARRAGVAWSGLAAAEKGRDPRRSTLLACLRVLPGLRADELLGCAGLTPPPPCPSSWSFVRDVLALHADETRVEVRVQRDGRRRWIVRTSGFRALVPERDEIVLRRRLMQLACRGSGALVRDLDPRRGDRLVPRLRVVECGHVHSFRFSRRDGTTVLDYECRSMPIEPDGENDAGLRPPPRLDPSEEEIAHAVDFPVERLVLDVQLGRRARPCRARVVVSPSRIAPAPDEPDLARYLAPGGLPVRLLDGGRRARVDWPRPFPGLTARLRWHDAAPGEAPPVERADGAAPPSVAVVVRAAREEAGLSLRALAAEAGVSHVTLVELERGRDPRASTLRALLKALPDLAPIDLLPAISPEGPSTPELAWRYERDLHGIEADLLVKRAVLSEDGGSTGHLEIVRLRSLRTNPRDLRLLNGLFHTIDQGAHNALQSLDTELAADQDAIRRRVIIRRDINRLEQLTIRRDRVRGGLTLRRTVAMPPDSYFLTLAQVLARRPGFTDQAWNGVSLLPVAPARRLRVELKVPAIGVPAEVIARAWPVIDRPDPLRPGVLDLVHRGAHELRWKPGSTTATLEVERPLLTLKYAIGWRLR